MVLRTFSFKLPAGCEHHVSQASMPAQALAMLEAYAYQYGESYDSYLATESDRQYFWSPGRRGVVGFVRWRRTLNILGGLLAAPADVAELLENFMEFARLNRLTINFVNIGRDQAKLFRRYNFKINKCGEELIVRLDRVNWQGKPYEWLRRQENYCVRQRLEFEEIDPKTDSNYYRDHIVPELEEVNRQHLAGTLHGRELVFFEGRFDPWAMRRRRLFVTREAGRIVAFLVCNPALAGDMWAIEMYRRRSDAPRGVIPYSMLQVFRQIKDEGALFGSLSSVPFLRCGPPIKNDDLRFQGGCQFFWYGMNWLFDIRGIYHFKSRFRPDSRELYMATYPRMTFASMFSLLFSWELLRVSPFRLARHVVQYWRSRQQRRALVNPGPFPERKILKLRRPARTRQYVAADDGAAHRTVGTIGESETDQSGVHVEFAT